MRSRIIYLFKTIVMVDLHHLFNVMTSNKILLSYKGEANKEILSSMLDILEQKIKDTDVSQKVQKKLYNILVESLQNLYHHNDIDQKIEHHLHSSSMFMLAKNEAFFKICTGNFIAENEVTKLEERIIFLNSLDRDELKAYHKEILNNGQISAKGGGGLGLIDMVRKSQNNLGYSFQKVDKNTYFFTLEVNVTI